MTIHESIKDYQVLTHGVLFTYDKEAIRVTIDEYESDIVFSFKDAKNEGDVSYSMNLSGRTMNIVLRVLNKDVSTFSMGTPINIGTFENGLQLAFTCFGRVISHQKGEILFVYTLWSKKV